MKLWQIISLGIIIIGIIGGAGYLGLQQNQPQPTALTQVPVTIAVSRGEVAQTVTAPGQLVDTQTHLLSLKTGGQLLTITVRPGSVVKQGDGLAQIDPEPLQDELAAAQLKLTQAQSEAAYQLAVARLELQSALTKYTQAQSATTTFAPAQAALLAAQAQLQALQQGPNEDEVTVSAIELHQAELALKQAQGDYDRIAYADTVGASPEAMQLQQATIAYEAALARYHLAQQKSTPAELAQANAAIAEAQARYNNLLAEQQQQQTNLQLLATEIDRSRIEIEQLQQGPDPQLLQAVEIAQKRLAHATLTAPFAGVVLDVLAQPGETVSPEQSLLRLTNPAGLEVQSSVIEEDLPYVQIGQQANIYFDAQPEAAIAGRVSRIVPQRIPGKDRPLYSVYLSLASIPPNVVAGMTADAAIIIARAENVLRLPRALVRARADNTAEVDVWTDQGTEKRKLTVGLRGDVYIEILNGLAEGEQVVGE